MQSKSIIGFLIMLSVLATTLALAEAAEKQGWPKAASIGTGSIGGTYYVGAAGFAKIIQEKVGVPTSVEVTGGSLHNPRHVHAKNMIFAMAVQSSAYQALKGMDMHDGKKYENVRAVWPQFPSVWHGWTVPRTRIKTLRDIEGRIVSCGPKGGMSTWFLPEYCKVLGITYKRNVYADFGDTVGMMRDGLIDAAFVNGGIPHPAANEVTSTLNGSIVGFTPEDLAKLIKAFPYQNPFTMKPKSYPGQAEPIETLADWTVGLTHKDVPEDFIYEVVKQIFANKKILVATHKSLEDVQEENFKNIAIPLHKGAYKYCKEQNIPVPKEAMPVD